jgi:tripeptide aminopeptidase
MPTAATLREHPGRVSSSDGDYLERLFVDLCAIPSPSGSERACAQRVLAELEQLGIETVEDDTTAITGSDSGNLLARITASPDSSPRPCLLLCAHLDTVPAHEPVEPVLIDGFFENSNEAILGADNKAAIAVILTLARHVRREGSPVDLELLFTVGEELALVGSSALDTDDLLSDFGYVFDHASPIGEVILSSPSHFRLQASFRGAAAHAGIRPQDGRSAIVAAAHAISAMPQGRVDDQTTVNVARIEGGSAINVVPERCRLEAEVRSLSDQNAEKLTEELVDHIHEAANIPACQCDVDISIQRTFGSYRTSRSEPAVLVAEEALRRCGHEPVGVTSGGASDANALIAAGIQVVNLANGTENNHEPTERVSARALHDMLAVALALTDCAAAHPTAR